jgi:putative flippase GtrA
MMPSDFRELKSSARVRKLVKFTLVSGISTVISFGSISLLYGLNIISSVIWATVAGNVIAAIPAYHLNRTWTWGKHGRSSFVGEVLPFSFMAGLGLGVSLLGAAWVRTIVHSHHLGHLTNTGLVAGTNIVSFGVFWVLKILVFNRIFKIEDPGKVQEALLEGAL